MTDKQAEIHEQADWPVARAWVLRERDRKRRFAGGIAADKIIGTDDPVAGNDERYGVTAASAGERSWSGG